jgi:hypothetical protein
MNLHFGLETGLPDGIISEGIGIENWYILWPFGTFYGDLV